MPGFLVTELATVVRGKQPDDLVFTAPSGGPLRNGNFRRDVYDRAAIRAGLPGLRIHDLRRTAASLTVAAGANVKAVQQMLGHASAAMTLAVYSGLFDDVLADIAKRLSEAPESSRVQDLYSAPSDNKQR